MTAAGAMRKHTQDRLELYDATFVTLAPNISQPTTVSNLGTGGVPAPLRQHIQTRLVCFACEPVNHLARAFSVVDVSAGGSPLPRLDHVKTGHGIQLICDVTNSSRMFMIDHLCAFVITQDFWRWSFGVKGHGEGWLN